MRYAHVARVRFPAGHTLQDDPLHARPHGHFFEVMVEESFEFMSPEDTPDMLRLDLWQICAEFARRDLNEMMIGGEPSMVGIGTWVLERLVRKHPNINLCEVSLVGEEVSVRVMRQTPTT